jgi:hypothetical protein
MDMMKMRFTLIALLAILAGCATPPPPVATDVNPITGERTDFTDVLLAGSSSQPREVVYLSFFRMSPQGNSPKYYILAKYIAPAEVGYLEVPPGQTLTLEADGQPIKLDGTGSINSRKAFKEKNNDYVSETAQFQISKQDMQKLGFARKISMKLRGGKLLVEREFGPENYDSIRAFVTRAVL